MTATGSVEPISEHIRKDHERIWLQNEAEANHQCEGRMWCQDNVWSDPDEHDPPTEYVRSDLYAAALALLDQKDETIAGHENAIRREQEATTHWCGEAAKLLERATAAEAENAELRRALEPFGEIADVEEGVGRDDPEDDRVLVVQAHGCQLAELRIDHFRAARAALLGQKDETIAAAVDKGRDDLMQHIRMLEGVTREQAAEIAELRRALEAEKARSLVLAALVAGVEDPDDIEGFKRLIARWEAALSATSQDSREGTKS